MVETVGLWQSIKSGIPTIMTYLGIAAAGTIILRYGLGWGQPTITTAGGTQINIPWTLIAVLIIGVLAVYFLFLRR